MSGLSGKRLIHVTTVDMSLVLLLGPQLRAFADAGMEVIGISAPGPYVSELESWGVRHVPLHHATRSIAVGEDVRALGELWELFRSLRPDIVHTHNPKPGLYGRIAARAAGVPGIVNTVHGLYAAPEDPLLRRSIVYSLERLASTCSGAELVQNVEDLAVLARLRIPAGKLVLLGNGIDLERFQPQPSSVRAEVRDELGLDDEEVVVGTVGRLVWGKGFRELFEAAVKLASIDPRVKFVVVGGSDPHKSDNIPDDELDSVRSRANISFTGPRDDVERLYAGFDLFVLPSYREGLPRSAMEAAAMGLPVVATDIRGCRQVVSEGQSGFLVPLHATDRLISAIEELARDPFLRGRMGQAGLRKARTEFDDRTVIATTMAAYERVLSEATSATRSRRRSSATRPS